MVATPPDEIARQHAEACKIIDSKLRCAPRVDRGEVPLQWKERPTIAISASSSLPANPNSPDGSVEVVVNNNNCGCTPDWCISSRGQVDVSPIVKLISEGVNELAAPQPSSATSPSKTKASKAKNGMSSIKKKSPL